MSSSGGTNDATQRRGSTTVLLLLIAFMIGVSSIYSIIIGNQAALISSAAVNVVIKNDAPRKNDVIKHRPTDTDVYSGEEIAKFLSGELSFPSGCASYMNGRCRLKFRPGTLPLTSAQTLQQCYIDAEKYKAHTHRSRRSVIASVSHEHKLIYRNIPKSASSTGRHAMVDFLEGKDVSLQHDELNDLVRNKSYTMISFIREPLTRFYSSYDEAYFRMGPWMAEGEIVFDKPNLREWFKTVQHKMDKYPYLYEGMKTIRDFRKMYCPQEVLDTGKPTKCNDYESIDDGRLLRRFERFVDDYDGTEPFDVHLNMQTTQLIYGKSGEPLPISALYNASDAEKGWQEVARQRGVTIPDGEMKHGRHQSRRFDVSKVSEATQQKICQILALDYCCLNFELPKVCEDIGLYCSLEQMEGARMWEKDDSLNLVIRPWDR